MKDLKDGNVKVIGSTLGTYMIELHNTIALNSWVLDTGCDTHICTLLQRLKERRKLKHEKINLIMGSRRMPPVSMNGDFELILSSGVRINLVNCCYSSNTKRNIISFHALFKRGFCFSFDNEIGDILVFKYGCFMIKSSPCSVIYESVILLSNNNNVNLNIDSCNNFDKLSL